MEKTLYLMRHGQTLFNQLGKIQGWCDSPLTEEGEAQARQARAFFESEHIKFDAAFSSTQERASDTLELVTDLPYGRVKALKEWNFGLFEGESERLNPAPPYTDEFVRYGGESHSEVATRMDEALTQIMSDLDGKTALAVSHGGACFRFLNLYHDITQGQVPFFSNCAIQEFSFDGHTFILKRSIDPVGHNIINYEEDENVKKISR